MAKKLVSGPILTPLAKIWARKNFFVDFISTRCYTLLQAIIVCNIKENSRTKLEKMAKTIAFGLISAPSPQIWAPKIFW